MKLTNADYAIWALHNSPMWATKLVAGANIDSCINGHSDKKIPPTCMAHNTMVLLKSVRSRGESLSMYLIHLSHDRQSPRRQGYARRWLKQMFKNRITLCNKINQREEANA